MKYKSITHPDINNGNGVRVTLWVSGCTHHCIGCHNKLLWDFNNGNEFDENAKNKLFEILDKKYIDGLTLMGGEPLDSYDGVLSLVKEVKEKYPDKDIWLFTGYIFKEIRERFSDILDYVDTIVDGKFEMDKRTFTKPFRGSTNQNMFKKNGDAWLLVD